MKELIMFGCVCVLSKHIGCIFQKFINPPITLFTVRVERTHISQSSVTVDCNPFKTRGSSNCQDQSYLFRLSFTRNSLFYPFLCLMLNLILILRLVCSVKVRIYFIFHGHSKFDKWVIMSLFVVWFREPTFIWGPGCIVIGSKTIALSRVL